MGLDMYLLGKVYIGGRYNKIITDKFEYDTKTSFSVDRGEKPNIVTLPTDKISEIVYDIGYWRKANQIHGWFVKNVQGNTDDCKEYFVDTEKLDELKSICNKLLSTKDREDAEELLPATSGFFFGDTDINTDDYWQNYWEDLEYTIKIIDTALEYIDKYGMCIYYTSSW